MYEAMLVFLSDEKIKEELKEETEVQDDSYPILPGINVVEGMLQILHGKATL